MDQLQATADRLGCTSRALAAVIKVECGGLGHGLEHGRPVVRLEVQHLWRRVPAAKREAVDAEFNVAGVAVPPATATRVLPPRGVEIRAWLGHQWKDPTTTTWRALHTGQELEWRALDAACRIDYAAAVCSSSWGLGQVLGADWHSLGFDSPAGFVTAQMTEAGQLDTMEKYLQASGAATRLKALDWEGFARIYNGPGAVDHYAGRLEEAYAKL